MKSLLLVPVVLSWLFWLITVLSVRRFMRRADKAPVSGDGDQQAPAVSIIKPVCGLEKNLYENLITACRQTYPDYEVIFAVQQESDPALAVLRKLEADCCKTAVKVVVESREFGVNGKVNNLLNALQHARGDVIVISDSDMHLGPDYLEHIVAPLRDRSVGIACTLYQAWRPGNIWEALELLTYNADFVPAMLFAYLSASSIVCPGATLAIRKEVLDGAGGLLPLADYFVEDFELGRRVVDKGCRIQLVPYIAGMDVDLTTFTQWWQHQVYWDQNTRSVNAVGYFLTVLVRGIPFALLYALCGGAYGWSVLAWTAAARMATGLLNARQLKDFAGMKLIWLLPLRDLLGLIVWLAGLFNRYTHWRGKRYALKKGKMVPVR